MGTKLSRIWNNIISSNRTLVHRSTFGSVNGDQGIAHGGTYEYVYIS